jgi:glycosyltransferase involved in cell wall biosynthesis
MRKNHLKFIKKYNLTKNVSCLGYLPHKESVRNLMESDVLWLMMFDNVRSPGKLYEYFGARKPILISSPDGNMRHLALETKAAIATNPKDVEKIENAISNYYKLWETNNLPVPNEEYIQTFDRQKLTADLARELSLAADY